MLGLNKGAVEIVAYHPEWHDLFEQERQILQHHLGNLVLDIQHVGSTAVPGLAAKPILDIAVAIASGSATLPCVIALCQLGYIDRGDAGSEGGYLLVKETARDIRTHHLHLVAIADPQWNNYLWFRDRLRADKTLRLKYARLKTVLQEKFAQDRKAYTVAKRDFIRDVISIQGDKTCR